MLLLMASCRDSIIDGGGSSGESDELVPISLNLQGLFGDENSSPTYSLTDVGDQAGTGNENIVNDVTVFVFNASNACEKIIQRTPFTNTDNPVGPELVKSGNKKIVVVANNEANFTSFYAPGQESAVNYNDLVRKLTDKRTTALPTHPYLMTGEIDVYLESLKSAANPNTINIALKRAIAKVKIYISKDFSNNNVNHTVEMQSITLHNGADRVSLLAPVSGLPINYNLSESKTSFYSTAALGTQNKTVPDDDGSLYCMLADTFYVYETLCGSDTSQAVYFDMVAKVNTHTTRQARFYLAGKRTTYTPIDTTYDVHRNYWYNVYLKITDPGLDSVYVTVKSAPWNLADTQKVVAGGGYEITEMAEPFKLVKYYTNDVITNPDPGVKSMAAIQNHTKGASWFRLRVSSGISWALNFKQPLTGEEYFSSNGGAAWHSSLTGVGDDNEHLIYVYRSYVGNGEPDDGPSFTLTVGTQKVRDFVVQPRDSLPIPINSYILRPRLSGTPVNETRVYIPLKEVYRYWEDCIYPNGDSIPDATIPQGIQAELLWQDRPSGNVVVQSLNIINASQREGAYLYAEAGSVQGNAVIALKVNGDIYWSFHLWVTEYNPYEVAGQKSYQGNIFMDRNLGALNNQYDAQGDARGLFYQFGRSTPFPRGENWTNNFMSTGSISSDTLPAASVPLTAIPLSLRHPMVFYTNSSSWPLSDENPYLWNSKEGNKTAFDPCPEGWRIPRQENASPWNGLDATNLGTGVTGYANGRYHASAGYYPFSGYMEGGALLTASSAKAYYWTSYSRSSTDGTGLEIDNSSIVNFVPDIPKSRGTSVRCVVDANYLQNMPGGGLFRK
jgi:uncharacterized protein (TIGR02145 family)